RYGIVFACLMVVLAACGGSNTGSTTTTSSAPSCKHPISLSQVNFGVIPAESTTSVQDATKPFSDALSKEICKPVSLFVGTNYTSIITAMVSKKADIASFGPLSYVLAADKGNAEAILRALAPTNKADHYYSYIITTPKTGIKTLNDLKGKTFSFTDPASTSGNLVPRYTLKNANIDPDKDLKATYVGSHDLSLAAVLSGKVQAGAVASDTYDKLLQEGKFKESDIVKVAQSFSIPEGPIAVRKDLSQSDKDAIQAAFLDITDPAALKALSSGGFIKDTDKTYDPIRDVAKKLGLNLEKLVK
ncbi:MAG: phosphate/phosphite/phosphonate ABC transporter substrate-binding protein, partial [Ktedonobacteraceae bacterium]|nr:phosphate/phosphite/phosphonate ABC transporter substrate-binding protein [Ktedonobacteraceae bacterium]